MTGDIVLAITGASGAAYAVRLLDVLLAAGRRVHLAISPAGAAVLGQELALSVDLENFDLRQLLVDAERWATLADDAPLRTILGTPPTASAAQRALLQYHHYRNLMAPIASGSSRSAAMVVCPCSGSTLATIAQGTGTNLIHRAADVHLKERRPLILVPRETPLSLVHLDNMRRAAEAGAIVLPAMPGFYHGVQSVRDLVDFVVARIADHLGIEHQLIKRWAES